MRRAQEKKTRRQNESWMQFVVHSVEFPFESYNTRNYNINIAVLFIIFIFKAIPSRRSFTRFLLGIQEKGKRENESNRKAASTITEEAC